MSIVTKSYRKNILRDLKSNLSRFISLFGIVLLGVMMLTGLVSFAPSMRLAGDEYFAQQNVFDLRVLSTLGLSQADIDAIAGVEGVQAVMPVQFTDLEARWNGDEELSVVRMQQLPADPVSQDPANLNRLVLLSGRMPAAPNECVVHTIGYGTPIPEGTVLHLPEDSGLGRTEFTVVGAVQDPQYISNNPETSTAGDGTLDQIVFVPDGNFTTDYYTACYIKVAGVQGLSTYSDEYQDAMDTVADRISGISAGQCQVRRTQLIEDAQHQLADAKATYEEKKAQAQSEFDKAEQELADAQQKLDAALAQLNQGEQEYSAGKAQLEAQKASLPQTMTGGADQLLSGQEQMLQFEDQLAQIEMLVNLKQVADPLLDYAEVALNNARHALEEAEPDDEEYTELRDMLAKAQSAYDNIYNQLQGYQQQLDQGKRQMFAQGLISSPNLSNTALVTEAKAALRQMKLALMSGQLDLSTGAATAYAAFDSAESQLADARSKLDSGWGEYRTGQQQLEDGRTEYLTQKADAERQLAEGLQQIHDAEEQISEIESGEWYVLDRNSTVSFVTFAQYADRMEAIARVFPIFFFLVAALVATTTMTRMVDENRLQLGTLKALGYSSASISSKYLFYGAAASLLGSAVGMVLGFIVFPSILWEAYKMLFQLPTFHLRFYPGLAAISVLVSTAIIGLATLEACRASLREKSAALLLPRAPVAGKRILLERITPLWKRMSFSQKTTARNLFRYKKRFFMTVLGVAGCTALLLIGFGIQDSILPMVAKQSTQLTHTDLTVSLNSSQALELENGLADKLETSDAVESWGAFYTHNVTLRSSQVDETVTATVVGAQDPSQMTRYFTFRDRKSGEGLPFEADSVILTEKNAEMLKLSVGDILTVDSPSGGRVDLVLTGIAEDYIFPRLYLSQQSLETLLGEQPEWNTVFGQTNCADSDQEDALRAQLLSCNYVSSVSFTEDLTRMFNNMVTSLNYVVILIIFCAAALAAVVLYNLISVNLAERKKELATIKVLGFYDKEVYRYIFREIELLSLIGAAVGLLLGTPLHQFIVRTVEMDRMMFIRSISPLSFVYSVALTMLFTFGVCFFMRLQVKRISMVESMKAPE